MNLVQITIYVSLIAQVLSTAYSLLGLNVPLFNENAILTDILGLETVVQFIELAFYVSFGFIFTHLTATTDIAVFRYVDWFLTTPTMILSTITFMDYIRRKENSPKDPTTQELPNLWTFLRENWIPATIILISNAFMLSMGLLKELNLIDIYTSTILGFIGFIGVFWVMREQYGKDHKINKYLWTYMTGTWSIYGFAATLPNVMKNTTYNLLDIVSKNFYSVFLTTYILNL